MDSKSTDTRSALAIVQERHIKQFRLLLESDGYFDKAKNIRKVAKVMAGLPVKQDFLMLFDCEWKDIGNLDELPLDEIREGLNISSAVFGRTWVYKGIQFTFAYNFAADKQHAAHPRDILYDNLLQLITENEQREEMLKEWQNVLRQELPKSWEKHGSLVMLPSGCFSSNQWDTLGPALWTTVAKSLKAMKVARKSVISRDGHRTPQVDLLYGEDGWVEHRDNSVSYMYDVKKCMFSSGNITEKLRIANWNCTGETVVDMYAGIGYFTLPYLVHAKASHVHACEWNPDAVIALKKTLALNGVGHRCTVHEGDNRQVCPRGVADRVNLGLIPSSQDGWPVACRALKPQTGGILHIHSNVTSEVRSHGGIAEASVSGEHLESACRQNLECVLCLGENSENEPLKGKMLKQEAGDTQTDCKDCVSHEDSCHHQGESFLALEGDTSDQVGATCEPTGVGNRTRCKSTLHDESSCDNCVQDHVKADTTHGVADKIGYNIASEDLNATKVKQKFSKSCKVKKEWTDWAANTSLKIKAMLVSVHKRTWEVEVLHIEHVKSYAPHIDHLVLDLMCKPIHVI